MTYLLILIIIALRKKIQTFIDAEAEWKIKIPVHAM